jgi:hypothetical protein
MVASGSQPQQAREKPPLFLPDFRAIAYFVDGCKGFRYSSPWHLP